MAISQTPAKPLVPCRYVLSITNIRFSPIWRFSGKVRIDVEILHTSSEVSLHAEGLKIARFVCYQGSQEIIARESRQNADNSVLSVELVENLQIGSAQIVIKYDGSIDNNMAGFFRAMCRGQDAIENAATRNDSFVLATQFEPCFARRAFPCFDEPNLKATFELEVECPEDLIALSNMPVKETIKLRGEKQGLKLVKFEQTPRMSTYLLAWAVGALEYVEKWTEQVHGNSKVCVRVYTPPGLSRYADFALDCATKVLDLYKTLFNHEYPLKKLDQLVVPEFVSGAMENWGLITYKPTKILFDPTTSNNRVKFKAAYVVAHELAHQWFGNLVTMNSWAELWLNEGFATWAGYMAVDTLYPEFDIWSQYIAEILDETFKLDSLCTTHAIEMKVHDENEALQMFDSISYFKGSSIIRMLANHLSQAVFLDGLSKYLKQHAYGNARSHELWRALSDASGQDVAFLMDAWIHARGFPIIEVKACNEDIILNQLSVLAPHENGRACLWQIPLGHSLADRSSMLLKAGASVSVPKTLLGYINKSHTGNCCVSYCPVIMDRILGTASSYSSADLVGIVSDASTLVLNAIIPTSQALAILNRLKNNSDPYLWLSIQRLLTLLDSIFHGEKAIAIGLKNFTVSLISRMKDKIQWIDLEDKSYRQAEFDKSMITLGSFVGEPTIEREARTRFAAWTEARNTMIFGPNLRGVILANCVGVGTKSDFDIVKNALKTDNTLDGQEILLNALCATSNPSLAVDLLDLAFAEGSRIDLQHLHLIGGALGRNNVCRRTQWEYVQENWSQVWSRLKLNATCRDWWIEESFRHFSDIRTSEDIGFFFQRHIGSDVAKPVAYIQACIARNSKFRREAKDDILQFIEQRESSR